MPTLSWDRMRLLTGRKPVPPTTRPVSEIRAEMSRQDTEMRLHAAVFRGRKFAPRITHIRERSVSHGGNAWDKAREWAGVFEGRVTQNAKGMGRKYQGVGWSK